MRQLAMHWALLPTRSQSMAWRITRQGADNMRFA